MSSLHPDHAPPTPPTTPARPPPRRPSPRALSLLLSLLAPLESAFFASLPPHLLAYLSTLPPFQSHRARLEAAGMREDDAYYLHRFELALLAAGKRPCVLLGFGDGRREEAQELDDRWVEGVWTPAAGRLREMAGQGDADARELLDALATLALRPVDAPVRSPTGVFEGHYSLVLASHPLSALAERTFHPPGPPGDDGWIRVSDGDVAAALGYPCAHPGRVDGLLDVEYREMGKAGQAACVAYYAGPGDGERVRRHFGECGQALEGAAELELWVSGERWA